MISVYDFSDYKKYFNAWVLQQPKKGHGEYRRLAGHLHVSTTLISQIFNADKHPSLEVSSDICDYLGLSEAEADYFILLVECAKAGSFKLKERFRRQIVSRQEKAKKIENRIKKGVVLSDEDKAVFYSSWIYSATRLLTAVPEYQDLASIASHLNLPRHSLQKVLDFLLQKNLVTQKSNRLAVSNVSTHVGSSSLLVNKHHQNWRILAFQKMLMDDPTQVFYTGPVALSKEAAEEIHKMILNFIVDYRKISGPSDSESVRCLNIDWFEV